MEPSKVTSKTSSLKSLVLKAWGERWTEIQWGISIKSVLPRGVSGDVYNLADIILSQALVGSYPNELVLSYLRHSLNCQLVSYAAILQRISKYDKFQKRSCVIILLDFLESTLHGITCRGKPEESVLAVALLSLVDWLLTCVRSGHVPKDGTANRLEDRIANKSIQILEYLLNNDFIFAMLYLAKHDDAELYLVIVNKCQEISQDVQNSMDTNIPHVHNILIQLCNIDFKNSTKLTAMESVTTYNEPITYVLQPLLAIRVMLNPTTETQVLVDKLKMIRQIKGYSNPRLYCELIRACLMCLRDSLSKEDHGPQWGAFTFIKLPHIIKHLCEDSKSFKASEEVIEGFEMLLEMFPLLDFIDSHTACSCIELLLNELVKLEFVTENQCSSIIARRASVVSTLSSPNPPSNVLTIIMRTEPTLQRMLRTLDSDYSKIQEALVSVLSQVLSGNSLELILAAASVEGKLRMFVSKVIKFNEFSKQINLQDGAKSVRTNAVLFDMTFLMLCFITQKYGYQSIFLDGGNDTFFEKWCRQCMVELGNPKSHETIMGECDPSKVTALLTAINDGEDLINCDTSWDQICITIIGATHDVLVAWENSTLSSNDVKRILDAMRSSMFCLPICAAAWLCSYMQVLHQDALLKPLNMVQQLLNVLPEPEESQDNYSKCRQVLMCQIIRKMQQDLNPPTMPSKPSHSIISKDSILEQLIPIWESILEEGWLNVKNAQKLKTTLFTAGSDWFVNNLIKEMMKLQYRDELEKAVDLLFAIFHFDIEFCTLALLELMPQYLFNPDINVELIEPQQTALAKLCSYCIYASVELQQNSIVKNDVHKTPINMDIDIDNSWPPNKIMRLDNGDCDSNGTGINGILLKALVALFRRIAVVASRHEQLCRETHFVLRLLEQLVMCGRGSSQIILRHLPPTLLPNLIRCVPELFTVDLILNLYDLNWPSGRKAATSDLCLLQKTRCSKNTDN
ncbi:mediator of RNA polymerase II transcription subunit 24 isoform X2 [Acyrthosiphon pisum]|uniref:Mediator of RNA polymerase II transcription subunit 24 n=1 Tax=Acyrthosiphon pisum TaxID=7029 RepID=A0A8R2H955_ACYPI|nr:mediator of RNA polymerase II transcription subunit 24 isoform X2 [Acyrthosiphon pisum]|eukprot:XP_016661657.1 PREDICTED: mediator of RNA polymerase II transcription subunit 24 isoform X2 [Acyrthosiphon pisum]